ncbi:MAG: hypothetical protein ACQERK_05850 [Campylobacterota bacterium]
MKTVLLIAIALLLGGCLYPKETGVSKYRYERCNEYYDVSGMYHNECDHLFQYSDLNPFGTQEKKEQNPCLFPPCP